MSKFSCTVPDHGTLAGDTWEDVQKKVDAVMSADHAPSQTGGVAGHVVSGGGRKRRGRTRRRHRSRHRRRRRHRRSRRSTKGSRSKTHRGDKNYTTKRGDKDFHRRHHDIRSSRSPYRRASGSRRAYSFF